MTFVSAGTPSPTGEVCDCGEPIGRIAFSFVTDDWVSEFGTWVGCADCTPFHQGLRAAS